MDKEYVVSRGIKVGKVIIEKGKGKRNGSLGEMRDESFSVASMHPNSYIWHHRARRMKIPPLIIITAYL